MKAVLKNYRQSPRKVRLLADLVRGKLVTEAIDLLRFVDKRAAGPITKVIKSAVANASDYEYDEEDKKYMVIGNITVDQAPTYKRMKPRARGSSSRINKRNSHITVELY